MNANAVLPVNIDKFYALEGDLNLQVIAFELNNQIFLIRKQFSEDKGKSFVELRVILCKGLEKVSDGKNFVAFKDKIFARSQKNDCGVFIALANDLRDLNPV